MSWFSKKQGHLTWTDVKVGQVYKFTNGYHIKRPYYAEVVFLNSDSKDPYFITNIPDYHTLKITPDNNWEYHRARMELMGDTMECGHLLHGQNLG